jgi:hypothetical protein
MSIKNDIDSVTFYACSTSWLEAVFCYSFFQAVISGYLWCYNGLLR